MAGDITATNLGQFAISGAELKSILDKQNVGAATAGAETDTIHILPIANSNQVTVLKLARSA